MRRVSKRSHGRPEVCIYWFGTWGVVVQGDELSALQSVQMLPLKYIRSSFVPVQRR